MATIYADPSAAPGGGGTSWGDAYDDFQDAINGVSAAGDIIRTRNTFNAPSGGYTIDGATEVGTLAAPIQVIGESGAAINSLNSGTPSWIWDWTTKTGGGSNTADVFWTFDNISFGYGGFGTPGGHRVELNSGGYTGVNDIIFKNCEFTGALGTAISGTGDGLSAYGQGLQFHNCTFDGMEDAIKAGQILCVGCSFWDIGDATHGNYVFGRDITMYQCICYDWGYNSSALGMIETSSYGGGTDIGSLVLLDNTFIGNDTASFCLYLAYPSTSAFHPKIVMLNNIMEGFASKPIFQKAATSDMSDWAYAGYNCCYNASTQDFGNLLTTENGTTDDPEFKDPANDIYRLKGTSPCVGTGLDAGVSYTEDAVGVKNDMGALKTTGGARNPGIQTGGRVRG